MLFYVKLCKITKFNVHLCKLTKIFFTQQETIIIQSMSASQLTQN